MNLENYIAISNLCNYYQVEPTFFSHIQQHDLIRIETFNEVEYISTDMLFKVEKMIRLYHDLNIHEESIDIVFNLIQKVESLQHELRETKNRLRVFQITE